MAEEASTTTTSMPALLVPGDGRRGGIVDDDRDHGGRSSSNDSVVSERMQLWLIVAGLVAIALLIGVWTVRYWRATRPVPDDTGEPGPDPAGEAAADPTTVFPSLTWRWRRTPWRWVGWRDG